MSISVEQLCTLVTAGFSKADIAKITADIQSTGKTQPETVPNTQPETVPNTQPETVPNTQPETVPNTQPETVPNTQPDVLTQMQNAILQLTKTVEGMQKNNANRDISNGAKSETIDDINKYLLGYNAPKEDK